MLATRGIDIEPAQEGRRLVRVACEFSRCIVQEDEGWASASLLGLELGAVTHSHRGQRASLHAALG